MKTNKVSKYIRKKCIRGKRKSVRSLEKEVIFGGLNPDGAMSQITTIRKAMRDLGVSVWMMQETKISQAGKLKFDGFVTYEHLRSEKDGGGLALSAVKELNPAL